MTELTIRPYQARDLEDVRTICFETGYMGDPISWQYRDRISFVHLFCDWHVLHHPDLCLVVADDADRAVGYLIGCADVRDPTRAAHETAFFRDHVVRRGLALRRGTAGFVWRSVVDLARDRRVMHLPVDLDRHPADLHIDLLPAARGRGLGAQLMTRWFELLRDRGVPGAHLGAWGENDGAVRFFRSQGFEMVGPRVPSPGFRHRDGSRATVVHLCRPA